MKGMYSGNVPKKARGSVHEAQGRNPNSGKHEPNDSPDGPNGPIMGYDGHGGMHGDTTVSGKHGYEFHFK